jgi:hypothetical protein
MKIKIIKCSKSTYWYNNEIGNTFDVTELNDKGYLIKNHDPNNYNLYVSVSDAEILNVSQNESPKVSKHEDSENNIFEIKSH